MTTSWIVAIGVVAILAPIASLWWRALKVMKRLEVAADLSRQQSESMLDLLADLGLQVDAGGATGLRIEAGAADVARGLTASQSRADQIDGVPGEAADEASRSGDSRNV